MVGHASGPAITTLLVKGVPRKYSAWDVVGELDAIMSRDAYDFVYVPRKRHAPANMGYAFINFVSENAAQAGGACMSGCRWARTRVVTVSAADVQGLADNLTRFQRATGYLQGRALAHAPLVFRQGENVPLDDALLARRSAQRPTERGFQATVVVDMELFEVDASASAMAPAGSSSLAESFGSSSGRETPTSSSAGTPSAVSNSSPSPTPSAPGRGARAAYISSGGSGASAFGHNDRVGTASSSLASTAPWSGGDVRGRAATSSSTSAPASAAAGSAAASPSPLTERYPAHAPAGHPVHVAPQRLGGFSAAEFLPAEPSAAHRHERAIRVGALGAAELRSAGIHDGRLLDADSGAAFLDGRSGNLCAADCLVGRLRAADRRACDLRAPASRLLGEPHRAITAATAMAQSSSPSAQEPATDARRQAFGEQLPPPGIFQTYSF